MRQDKFSKAYLTLYACGVIPVVWLALLLAPYMGGGLVGLVRYGGAALDHPFHIVWCEDSLKTVLIFCCAMGWGLASTSPPTATTAGGRNTAAPSGAIQKESTGNMRIRS